MINYQNLKNNFFIITGPNVIESEEHVLFMAKSLKEILFKYNVQFIFKTSFDKANRSSLNSYRGVNLKEGLRILKRVRDEVGIPVITDIHDVSQAKIVGEVVDIIQIPAFLCRQTDLLKAAAETGKIIQIKKGQFCSAEQMHKAKEKVISFGNEQVILCERGNSWGYQDLVVDPRNLIWLKSDSNLVSMDITHCLQQPSQVQSDGTVKSGGLRELIPWMGKMAVSFGINGIFMEVHDRPDESLCDAPTQWYLSKLEWLLDFIGIEKKNDLYNFTYKSSTTNCKAELGTMLKDKDSLCKIKNKYLIFVEKHHLFRNPCGELNVIEKIVYDIFKKYDKILVIDGGYCDGNWSKLILKSTANNFDIKAYEVNKKIFMKNILFDKRLELYNLGLSDKNQTIKLNCDDLTESFTIYNNLSNGLINNYDEINLIRLDEHIKNNNYKNIIIKLDIESFEYKVLTTLSDISEKILLIQFEYHNIHKNNIPPLNEYYKLLKKINFDLFVIGEDELLDVNDHNVNFFDICNEKDFPINCRPDYKGGSPDYNKLHTKKHIKNYKPENINLIAIRKNISSFYFNLYNKNNLNNI